jgi:hypothetical protein
LAPIWRIFFEAKLALSEINSLCLQEGSAMQQFSPEEILTGTVPLTPYDAFALWLHINRGRLTT